MSLLLQAESNYVGRTECGAVLFDLDGVLVDSTPCVARVWERWARVHGLEPARVVKLAHGRRAIETVELLAPALDSNAELAELERWELDETDGLVAIPGAAALLASLPPRRWAVVTSGTRRLAFQRMRLAGLQVPETMVSADEVSLGKPDPAPFLRGAELLGCAPGECVVIEDTPPGIEAGRRAGMQVFAVPTTYPAADLARATVVLDSLAQLRVAGRNGGPKTANGTPIQLLW